LLNRAIRPFFLPKYSISLKNTNGSLDSHQTSFRANSVMGEDLLVLKNLCGEQSKGT